MVSDSKKYTINELERKIYEAIDSCDLCNRVISKSVGEIEAFTEAYIQLKGWYDIFGDSITSTTIVEPNGIVWKNLVTGAELRLHIDRDNLDYSFLIDIPLNQDLAKLFVDIMDLNSTQYTITTKPPSFEYTGLKAITKDIDIVRKIQNMSIDDYEKIIRSKEFSEFWELRRFSSKVPYKTERLFERDISEKEMENYRKKHEEYMQLKKKLRKKIEEMWDTKSIN
jgi:hypothetical protein